MRQAGTITIESEARKFADYLATLGVESRVDREADGFGIWVRDDDLLAKAKEELESFRVNPADERYAGAEKSARELRAKQVRKDAQVRKNIIDARRLWHVAPSACPATKLLIALCILVYAVAILPEKDEAVRELLRIAPIGDIRQFTMEEILQGTWYQEEGLSAIKSGQVWRLVTPMFLHARWDQGFGILHLLFNLFWLQDLGTQIELRRGSWRFLAMVLVISALSNLAQYAVSGPNFGGMSGVNYGLFGYIWMKSKYDPLSHFGIWPQTVQIMLVWFVLCWIGLVGGVANTAHTVGLLVGMAFGFVPPWLRRLRGKSRFKKSGLRI